MPSFDDLTRRKFVGAVAAVSLGGVAAEAQTPEPSAHTFRYSLTINGQRHELDLEPRVTLLDLLRERLQLTGSKKGCDHGQCGACTVLVDGARVNSCLTLAVMQDGKEITTIEGLAEGEEPHPMQAAFIEHDGFQCGFCTSGQICSAVAMLHEARASGNAKLSDDEIRERMSGNICRCGAYPNIVAAIRDVQQRAGTAESSR
jgi:xanthine dehydrogenase YagT iron-sulfur-binding subunit